MQVKPIYLIFLISCFQTLQGNTTGIFGEYTLAGKAISREGKLLKNAQILFYIGSKKDTLYTNSDGDFKVQIPWSSTCNSRKNRWKVKYENLKANPRFIFFRYKNSIFKFKNDWLSYKQLRNNESCKIIVKFD